MVALTKRMNVNTDTPSITLDSDPQYRRQTERLLELEARERALEQRREALAIGLGQREAAADVLTRRAERLLADDVVPLAADVEIARMRADLAAVSDELNVTRKAIELHKETVRRERARASAAVCARLSPRHQAIVARIAAALTELSAALVEERELRDELNRGGVIFSGRLRPMPLPSVGTLDDPNSAASRWLSDARSHGLVD
jgi:hypothetical protein